MTRKTEGTNKFVIYLFNGKMVEGGILKPKEFVYKQSGRVYETDENGEQIGKGTPFLNYGGMLSQINRIMRKSVIKNIFVSETEQKKKQYLKIINKSY